MLNQARVIWQIHSEIKWKIKKMKFQGKLDFIMQLLGMDDPFCISIMYYFPSIYILKATKLEIIILLTVYRPDESWYL